MFADIRSGAIVLAHSLTSLPFIVNALDLQFKYRHMGEKNSASTKIEKHYFLNLISVVM